MMRSNYRRHSLTLGYQTVLSAWLLAALCVIGALAQAAQPAAASDTVEFTTANGLKTIHRRVAGNEVVAVQIYFRGGSRNISEKNAGIESLMFEAATQGTKNFPKSQLNRELARMGTVIDAASGYDFSVVAMRCNRIR